MKYPGDKVKAKEKFKRLKSHKIEKYQSQLDLLYQDYADQLKKYLQTLSPDERKVYKKQLNRKQVTSDTD